jgi:hypothetical protein
VNQTFVRQYLNGRDAVGETVLSRAEPNYPATRYQIIGVVNDTKYADLKEEIPAQAFVPQSQYTAAGAGGTLFIRGNEPVAALIPAVHDRLQLAPQMGTEFSLFETQEKALLPTVPRRPLIPADSVKPASNSGTPPIRRPSMSKKVSSRSTRLMANGSSFVSTPGRPELVGEPMGRRFVHIGGGAVDALSVIVADDLGDAQARVHFVGI